MLIRNAVKRKFTQVAMLQDNLQAIRATVNLKSRAHFWRHNRILKAMILHLRSSSLLLHLVWVPNAYQPANPLSKKPYFSRGQVRHAAQRRALIWNDLVQNIHVLECKGVPYAAA